MNKKGFTLIELLVVIAIIGLLSTLAVVSLNNARGKARDARRTSDLKSLQSAIELYKADNNDAVPAIIATDTWATLTTALATYLPAGAPIDPNNDATYFYKYCADTATNTRYVIGGLLENNPVASGLVGTVIAATYAAANDCVNSTDVAKIVPTCNATTGFCLGDLGN